MSTDFLRSAREFLDLTYSLATGPNLRQSKFGVILEGVFRKDYFTLETIIFLRNKIEEEPGGRLIFGGSILDLSRRVLEDMVYMVYIKERDVVKYSERFMQFDAVEQKRDFDFLVENGVSVEPQKMQIIQDRYSRVPEKLKDRNNWAGQSVEEVIAWLLEKGKLPAKEKDTLLKFYVLGNRKNHTSSSDILNHSESDVLEELSEHDVEIGLLITYGAALKVALLLIDEVDCDEKLKSSLRSIWTSMGGRLAS